MEDWISRVSLAGSEWDGSCYSRRLLPPLVARRWVEGGAPYLHSYGFPGYEKDSQDDDDTYPTLSRAA